MSSAHNFLRTRSGKIFVAFVAGCWMAAVALGFACYRMNLHWFEVNKFEEKVTALKLVEAFVANYTIVRGAELGVDAPVPATFRAHSIELFNKSREAEKTLSIQWLGVPGREIKTAPRDPETVRALMEYERKGDRAPQSRWRIVNNLNLFRTILPSVAALESCVECHNRYVSDGRFWRVGDVMGAFVLDAPADDFLNNARYEAVLLASLFFLFSSTLGFTILWLQHKRHIADMTASTGAERERMAIKARDAAEAANRAKSEFLALMSHELRTPLNAINGFSELIANEYMGPVNDRYRSYAEDIHRSGQHLLQVIGDILDIAKAGSGRLELNEEETSLKEIIEPCLRVVAARAKAGSVEVKSQIPVNAYLRGDVTKLRQIVLNLLSNAVKFTPPNGRIVVEGNVECHSAVSIRVTDTGIGMAAEDIPRALRPFEQIESQMQRKHEGTGLGLPLAQVLAELHGGSLQITSTPSVGTTVTVLLPADRLVRDRAKPCGEAA